jgi:RNA polymerase sigma-70 factor (ECF subfamily)
VTLTPDAWLAAPSLALEVGEEADGGPPTRPPAPPPAGPAIAENRAELSARYAQHARAIHRFLCDMLGDHAAAADATQETFARAFRRIDALVSADRPVLWLFGIARHVSHEMRRARRRARRVIADAPADGAEERCEEVSSPRSPEDELMGREAVLIVDGALSRLAEDRRAALLLRLDHGLCYEEIAGLMGWSVPKVKVEIHRARQVLRAELL